MSDIPDAVSSDMLRSLLDRDDAPLSALLPELNFGRRFGGPCDLQYVVSSLIAKSTNGVNLIQLMMTALHLLIEIESQLKRQHAQMAAGEGGFAELNTKERDTLARVADRNHGFIRSSVLALEQTLDTFAPISSQLRIQELLKQGVITQDTRLPIAQLRSILLLSDEILDSLGITREAITAYLDKSDSLQTP
jgi:hypothetical protein